MALLLAGLVVLLFAPVLKLLVLQWWQDPDYGHGFFVPLFSGYVVWRERARWQNLLPEASNSGLLVMLGAIGLLVLGSLGAELFISRFSLLVLLAGMALYLGGPKALRNLALPLCFLIFMIPLPKIIYNQITFPLQLLASRFAVSCLDVARVPAVNEGNLLFLPNQTLEVVEACSGIRSLMSLEAFAVAYGYWAERRWWMRIILMLLALPLAVISNGLRVVGTGVLTYIFGPQAAEGFFHVFSGWLVFLSAVLLFLIAHAVISRFLKPVREGEHA